MNPKSLLTTKVLGAVTVSVAAPALGLLTCYSFARLYVDRPQIEIIELEKQRRDYIQIKPGTFNAPSDLISYQDSGEPFLKGPWVLYHRPNSARYWARLARTRPNKYTRYFAIEYLSRLHDLPVGVVYQAALKCDYKALLELSHLESTDINFFQKPGIWSYLPMEMHLTDHIYSIFYTFQRSKYRDECSHYHINLVLQDFKVPKEPGEDNFYDFMSNDVQVIFTPPHRSLDMFTRTALESIKVLTIHKERCDEFVMNGGIQLLTRIWSLYKSNEDIMAQLGRVLINISKQQDDAVDILVAGGFLHILSTWLKSWSKELQSIATTILKNLSQDDEKFSAECFLLSPKYGNSKPPKVDVIFVHGLNGSTFFTWRQKDEAKSHDEYTKCWPMDWVGEQFPNSRIIGLDYASSTSYWQNHCQVGLENRNIKSQAKALASKLKKCGVGNRPIVWVGHSYGGLVIKQMLSDAAEDGSSLLTNTTDILFCGVPHKGSALVEHSRKLSYVYFPVNEVLELGNLSLLRKLDKCFAELVVKFKINCVNFIEEQKTQVSKRINLSIVPSEFAEADYAENITLEDDDHVSICKPKDRESLLYKTLCKSLYKHTDTPIPSLSSTELFDENFLNAV